MKDETEQLSVAVVSGKQPDYKTIRAAAFKYQNDTCVAPDCDPQMKSYCMTDFIAGAKWALSQVACASGALDTVAERGLSKHVCGAQGYNPMLGDTCEGCETERSSREGQP